MPEAFAEFRALVQRDPELCRALYSEKDPQAFAELACRLGSEHGFIFTVEDVAEVTRAAKRAWFER